jgi:hypothetical protein
MKVVANMNAVAHQALSGIVKLHPKHVTGYTLFGDVGMLPASLTIHLSKLVWQNPKSPATSGGTIDVGYE